MVQQGYFSSGDGKRGFSRMCQATSISHNVVGMHAGRACILDAPPSRVLYTCNLSIMSTATQQEALHQEGRLMLAAQAYKRGDFQSYTAAANAYDVPRSTLHTRVTGVQQKRGSIAKNRLLTPTEEETLYKWITSMDLRGMPPTAAAVRSMASLLIAEHRKPATVG